jgi:hypothetical protein
MARKDDYVQFNGKQEEEIAHYFMILSQHWLGQNDENLGVTSLGTVCTQRKM